MKKFISIIIILISIISCDFNGEKAKTAMVTIESDEKDSTQLISKNIDELGKILDFSVHRPIKVMYKYSSRNDYYRNYDPFKLDSTNNYIEALLFFDSVTFDKMSDVDKYIESIDPELTKELFDFDWLPKNIRTELYESHPNYTGHHDYFFDKKEYQTRSWYLDEKILLIKPLN